MKRQEQWNQEMWLLEINARKEVIKKLSSVLKRLRKVGEVKLQERKAQVEARKQYASVEEARELWGYNGITDDELHEIERMFEEGELYVQCISPQEAAVKILENYISGLYIAIRGFESELSKANV